MGEQKTTASSVNRAKTYQLVLFPLKEHWRIHRSM